MLEKVEVSLLLQEPGHKLYVGLIELNGVLPLTPRRRQLPVRQAHLVAQLFNDADRRQPLIDATVRRLSEEPQPGHQDDVVDLVLADALTANRAFRTDRLDDAVEIADWHAIALQRNAARLVKQLVRIDHALLAVHMNIECEGLADLFVRYQ